MSNNERQRLDLLPAAGNRVVIMLTMLGVVDPAVASQDGRPCRVEARAGACAFRSTIHSYSSRHSPLGVAGLVHIIQATRVM